MTQPVGVRIIAIVSFLEAAGIAIMGTGPMFPVISQLLKTDFGESKVWRR